jgi:hypothetical protein
MHRNIGFLIATMCRYDFHILGKNVIIKFPHTEVTMRGIFRELFPLDLLENFSPVREYFLGPYYILYVSKDRRLNENLLGGCLDDGHHLWSKF